MIQLGRFHNDAIMTPPVMKGTGGAMSVTLSIKNVPESLAEKLRQRAARSERSLQGELLMILKEAVEPRRRLTAAEAFARVKALGLRTEADSVDTVRAARDGR